MRIKLLLVSLVTFCCMATTTFAQVKVGVEAGANLSKFVGTSSFPSEKGNLKAGYQVGVTADYEFKNHLMLMSGLSFIQRRGDLKLGMNYAGETPVMTFPKVETKINYLQIPVALGYNFRVNDNFSLIPSVGVYVAYGFGAGKCDLNLRGNNANSVGWKPLHGAKEYGLDAFRHWDWGGTVGLKAVIGQHYTLAFHYSVGIMQAQTHYGLRNSTYQLSVGYRF